MANAIFTIAESSVYDDQADVRYHFPKTYLSQAKQAEGDWILYYEPTFEFLLLPTVLKELDGLKMLHRNPEVRDKAKRAITRIKGWRAQGPLLEGVIADKTIRIRAVHNEPDVSKSISWLDPKNEDDRIIASILQIQAARPTARVLLVTGDINLQNKADAAMIEIAELDET
ncbi:MAG: hypothetical protein JWR07_5033 [Nevskia sp.]|nr:hypothetical protein [Nevskia sp.]